MSSTANLAHTIDLQVVHDQHRLRTAVATGLQLLQRIHVEDCQQFRGNGAVCVQRCLRMTLGVITLRQGADLLPEGGDLTAVNGKTCGQFVTAVAFKQRRKA